jgi:hypothetical protein
MTVLSPRDAEIKRIAKINAIVRAAEENVEEDLVIKGRATIYICQLGETYEIRQTAIKYIVRDYTNAGWKVYHNSETIQIREKTDEKALA